jgi:DNA repair protein RadC
MNVSERTYCAGPEPRLPREKALESGIECLSDQELVCLVLGSGTKARPLPQLARLVLEQLPVLREKGGEALTQIHGIGDAKALSIMAGLELARRFFFPARSRIKGPEDVFKLIRHYGDREKEHFFSVSVNGAHEALHTDIVSVGILNRTLVHPREIFSKAIQANAAAIVLAHNHPSGHVTPSPEDREVTANICAAGKVLGIPVLDHVIFCSTAYYSFENEGLL